MKREGEEKIAEGNHKGRTSKSHKRREKIDNRKKNREKEKRVEKRWNKK